MGSSFARRDAAQTGLDAIEYLDGAGFQRILGADDEEPGVPDRLFQDLGAVSTLVGRGAHVGSNGALQERVDVVPEAVWRSTPARSRTVAAASRARPAAPGWTVSCDPPCCS